MIWAYAMCTVYSRTPLAQAQAECERILAELAVTGGPTASFSGEASCGIGVDSAHPFRPNKYAQANRLVPFPASTSGRRCALNRSAS
jgi:hypothetical protein